MTKQKTLGELLKQYRLKVFPGMTLREVDEKIGVTYSYISLIEAGAHKPSDEILKLMVDGYELSPKEQREVFLLAHSTIFAQVLNESFNLDKAELGRALHRRSNNNDQKK